MDQDRLDKFIKDKVFDHLTPSDTDALWQGILEKQEAEEKPKRRFLGFWLLAGLLLIAGLAGYGIFGNSDMNNNSITKNEKGLENKGYDSTLNHNKEQTTTLNNTNSTAEKPAYPNKEENKIEMIEASSSLNLDNNSKKNHIEKKSNNSNTFFKHTTKKGYDYRTASSIGMTTSSQDPLKMDEGMVKGASVDPVAATPPATLTPENSNATITKKNNLITGITLNSLRAVLEQKNISIIIDEVKIPETVPPVPIEPRVKKTPWSIGAHFSYGLSGQQLSSANKEDQSAYIKLRNQSETATQVLSGGLDLRYLFKSGLFAKAGLQYEQITERFDYDKTTVTPIIIDEAPISIFYSSNGITDTIYGPTESIKERTQKRKIYNRYRTIDLPLLMGYHPNTAKQLSWFVEGGLLINLAFIPRGEILDTTGIERIDLSENEYFRKNIGLGLVAGAGASYQLTKDWSVWMSPKIRYSLGSMTGGDYLLEQRYWRGALEIGGRFGF